jgi:hypothetical protein
MTPEDHQQSHGIGARRRRASPGRISCWPYGVEDLPGDPNGSGHRTPSTSPLPEMDGLATTGAITADDDLAGVRVLILTTFEADDGPRVST